MSNRFVTSQSFISLDVSHPYTRRMLVDAQDFHRNVMSGFRGWAEDGMEDPRRHMGVLSAWAVDLRGGTLALVVQSKVSPDWSSIPEAALRGPVEVRSQDFVVREGDVFSFRVTVSVVRDIPRPKVDGMPVRSKRVPLRHPDDVREWFVRTLDSAGSPGPLGAQGGPERIAVRPVPALSSNVRKGLKITRHDVRGEVEVTDSRKFVSVLENGLGRARAYSCGLVLVKPVEG